MTRFQQFVKRSFDVVAAAGGLLLAGPVILIATMIARRDTGLSGFFRQTRVGLNGKPFEVLKIRTMRNVEGTSTTVTTTHDCRITRFGAFFRRTKIDELPQLWNVLKGEMSFVGPRPDVPGQLADLSDEDRIEFLSIRPGITGPASLKYRNEEELLAGRDDPEVYNRGVIFPDKVRMNREYIANCTFWGDMGCLFRTIFGRKGSGPRLESVDDGAEDMAVDVRKAA